ncbi:MAG: hypothetical protein JST55_16400 [Bacteroidetes bacterium]|nr:hypothetical protein [Bacteroidota bacterium]
MINIDLILELIKNGIETAYYDLVKHEDYSELLKDKITEYLITVGVVKKLLENTKKLSTLSSIRVEYDSDEFLSHAFTFMKLFPSIRQRKHESIRKGRIDIAILDKFISKPFKRSVCGIEIKAINPHKGDVKKDFLRFEHALLETDPIGENSIEVCFIAFLKRLDTPTKCFNEADYIPAIENSLAELSEYKNNTKLDVNIKHFSVFKESVEEYVKGFGENTDSIFGEEIPIYTGAVEGFIIIMKRKDNE